MISEWPCRIENTNNQMTIVIPISLHDLHLAAPLAAWMAELGPYPNHRVILAWAPEIPPEDRADLRLKFAQAGWLSHHSLSTVLHPHETGWPGAPEGMFRCCAISIEASVQAADKRFRAPWWFFEPDCTPMRRGWADDFEVLWKQDRTRPFLGSVETVCLADGSADGKYLAGAAIYPHNLSAYTKAHLDTSAKVNFDHALRRDILPISRHTDLLQNCWTTQNYRRLPLPDGSTVIQFDAAQQRESTVAGSPRGGTLRPNALVVHGCKDSSLIRLLETQPEDWRNEPRPSPPSRKDIRAVQCLAKRLERLKADTEPLKTDPVRIRKRPGRPGKYVQQQRKPGQPQPPDSPFAGLKLNQAILRVLSESMEEIAAAELAERLRRAGYRTEQNDRQFAIAVNFIASSMARGGTLQRQKRLGPNLPPSPPVALVNFFRLAPPKTDAPKPDVTVEQKSV